MPKDIEPVDLSESEIEQLLTHIFETISVYDYPTPAIFSALSRLSIVSFLRAKSISDVDIVSVDVFRQLTEFSHLNRKYLWFIEWSNKLIEFVKEKKVETA